MINKLKAFLKEKGSTALIMSEENVSYFTSFHSTNGYLAVTGDKAIFLTDSRYIEAARSKIKCCDEILEIKKVADELYTALKGLSPEEICLEGERTTVARYNFLSKTLDFAKINCDGTLDKAIAEIRGIKSAEEIGKIITAQRIAERAFDHILRFIEIGKSEREISLELDYFMLKNGADALSFKTIAVAGKNSSMPHGVPGDYRVQRGDFITMDYGAVSEFYHSDMTRTVAVGEVSSKQAEVYETVLRAQKAGLAAVKEGAVCREVDAAARGIIAEKGYGECFGHGLGHGVGVEIHEYPTLNPSSETILAAGHIVTVEPGIYIPGEFGVRIEDMAAVTREGCDNLTKCEKKLIIL